ncbi:MAG TPA: polyprenyl synthetase family protein [Methanosarcinales archaeon]|nr:MAG: polyprenyl synthetase family protein [Methanosarcinales archaeon]HDN65558.1 polyprenyl synthetase family protein [Methanosarcinales archaeon]
MITDWYEYRLINGAIVNMVDDLDESNLKRIIRHVFDSGGKKIRPIILILSSELFGGDADECVDAALAIELIHSASLIHDDILDVGLVRRGVPSVYNQFGLAAAILCGDFLISKSIELISKYDRAVIQDFGRAGMSMSEGEALDVNSNEADFSENDYFECISKKTASLFAASARMGGRIGRADVRSVSRCTEFGMHLGMAYQIIDDILECKELQHEKKSENTATTLPHILKHDAIDLSIKEVQHHVDCSKQIINSFNETEVRTKLHKIVDYMTFDLAGAVE